MPEGGLRIEYIEARRVLLDALTALAPHLHALVLVGAQAVYLRTASRDPASMRTSWFPSISSCPRSSHRRRDGDRRASPASTARQPLARAPAWPAPSSTAPPIELASLEDGDTRLVSVKVAGYAALLVAKLHKLGDRLNAPDRLHAKDAGDVYRLFDTISPFDMATTLRMLLDDERSAATTTKALSHLEQLFVTRASTGTRLAVAALHSVLPEDTVSAAVTAYVAELRRSVDATERRCSLGPPPLSAACRTERRRATTPPVGETTQTDVRRGRTRARRPSLQKGRTPIA